MVNVVVPGTTTELGLNVATAPAGKSVALRLTLPLNPPIEASVRV